MPDIQKDLQDILAARYGREVRGSIHDAIRDINEVVDGNVGTVTALTERAENAASRAETSAQGIDVYAQRAETAANNAKASETEATRLATEVLPELVQAGQKALTDATTAHLSDLQNQFNTDIAALGSKVIEAESYTKGGTGSRSGEDTDNAKYYMEEAKKAAGGDYVSNSEKGAPNGVATLGADGKVPTAQLPNIATDAEHITYNDSNVKVALDNRYTKTEVDSKIATLADDTLNLKMLGWTVPKELGINNYIGTDGKFHKKVGRVDSKDLIWNAYETSTTIVWAEIQDIKIGTLAGVSDIYLRGYKADSLYNVLNSTVPKSISVHNTLHRVYLQKANASDVIDGYIYYELATEEVLELDGHEAGYFAKKNVNTNLLKPTLQSTTSLGVTFTNNGDGTYTLNGTARERVGIYLFQGSISKGKRFLGCPKGGSESTYYLGVSTQDWSATLFETGDGVNIPNDFNGYSWYIVVMQGTVCNNLIFKPMLTTDLSATYDDFVPYTGDTGTLNGDVAKLAEKTQGWELMGSVTGANSVAIDSTKYGEFMVVQYSHGTKFSHIISSIDLPTTATNYNQGYYITSNDYGSGVIQATKTQIKNLKKNVATSDSTASTTMTVYGRRWGV